MDKLIAFVIIVGGLAVIILTALAYAMLPAPSMASETYNTAYLLQVGFGVVLIIFGVVYMKATTKKG